jgi:aromatic ring-cleaving dioxygenase
MKDAMRPPRQPAHNAYHAHVYFDASTLEQARKLTEEAGRRFDVELGRLHEKPVGPHPNWSRQIAFDASTYRELLDWLDANRGGLTVLVHGLTGDDLADHTDHACWLGEPANLDLRLFKT